MERLSALRVQYESVQSMRDAAADRGDDETAARRWALAERAQSRSPAPGHLDALAISIHADDGDAGPEQSVTIDGQDAVGVEIDEGLGLVPRSLQRMQVPSSLPARAGARSETTDFQQRARWSRKMVGPVRCGPWSSRPPPDPRTKATRGTTP
ncbi:hypothetical protein FXW78_46885 [Rhodococcus opacus]|nr:hypothetical protein [Rhodococcus opacus]